MSCPCACSLPVSDAADRISLVQHGGFALVDVPAKTYLPAYWVLPIAIDCCRTGRLIRQVRALARAERIARALDRQGLRALHH